MSNYNSIKSLFNDIAVKIQDKLGNHTDKIKADDFPSAIESIAGGDWLPSAETVLATFARRQSGGDGPATIEKIYGKTVVWNQEVPISTKTYSGNGITITNNGDGSFTANGTATGTVIFDISFKNEWRLGADGHRVLIKGCPAGGGASTYKLKVQNFESDEYGSGRIVTFISSSTYIALYIFSGTTVNFTFRPVLFDLTLMYGEGKEPSTVAEFLSMHPEALTAPYDAGSLLPVKAESIITRGVNQWDEEWEPGYIDGNGDNAIGGSMIRSKGYIAVNPGGDYYIKTPTINGISIKYYAADKSFISTLGYRANTTITIPNNVAFVRFFTNSIDAITTYNHDICINLSDPAINGHYYPHWRGSLSLNLSTLTGKLNGEGASVVVYPDGLRGVGDIRDEASESVATKKIGVVDLGSLTWSDYSSYGSTPYLYGFARATLSGKAFGGTNMLCAEYETKQGWNTDKAVRGDSGSTRIYIINSGFNGYTSAQVAAALSGIALEYTLATPLTYTLDTPLPTDLTCEQGDILQRVSDNNCPFVGEMKFGL